MHKSLYEYIDNNGSFVVSNSDIYSRLYFPLANEEGLLETAYGRFWRRFPVPEEAALDDVAAPDHED